MGDTTVRISRPQARRHFASTALSLEFALEVDTSNYLDIAFLSALPVLLPWKTATLEMVHVFPFFMAGLKEARLKTMMPIHTGRYFEATVARGEEVQDLEAMHSLRIDNLPDVTT